MRSLIFLLCVGVAFAVPMNILRLEVVCTAGTLDVSVPNGILNLNTQVFKSGCDLIGSVASCCHMTMFNFGATVATNTLVTADLSLFLTIALDPAGSSGFSIKDATSADLQVGDTISLNAAVCFVTRISTTSIL